MSLTQDALKGLLDYNVSTGDFYWKKRRSGVSKQLKAGWKENNGYWRIKIDGVKYQAHRLAWLYTTGNWPKDQIDHIDGDRLNNSIFNLRVVDNQTNCCNTQLRSNNTSGVVGVSWHKRHNKWQVSIGIDNVLKYIGRFDDFEEACFERKLAEKRYGFHENHGRK